MNYEEVTLTIKTYWRFKDNHNLKVTKCKKIIDTKRGVFLKYGLRGFYINGKYYKRKEINKLIEVIPKKQYYPF
jgi:hypothetical protein